jgi:DinB family protein
MDRQNSARQILRMWRAGTGIDDINYRSSMRYSFLVDTYETERLKVLSVWGMFRDEDLPFRPHPTDTRGRSFLEQMQHQCLSENVWFCNMLGIDVGAPPLPPEETRLGFVLQYETDSLKRLGVLRSKADAAWWEEEVAFFDVRRSRAWIMVRRIAHTSHHRGQQMAMLRMLGRDVYSNYGPTADTGNQVIYAPPPE